MDTEDWYEALNAFDANDEETLRNLSLKHVERYMIENRVAPKPKYLTDGEYVW